MTELSDFGGEIFGITPVSALLRDIFYPMQASVPYYPCITCTVDTYVTGEFAT